MEFFVVGAAAGLISDCVVHPIDTLRTRLQTQHSLHTPSQTGTRSAVPPTRVTSFSLLRSILKYEGPRALYQGFGIVALSTVPAHALYFYGYEHSKRVLKQRVPSEHEHWIWLISGFYADVLGSVIWTPMDVIKQRMQLLQQQQQSTTKSWGMLKRIVKEEGGRGLFRGYAIGLMTFGPYVSLYFYFYESWKRYFSQFPHLISAPTPSSSSSNESESIDKTALLKPYLLYSGAVCSSILSSLLTTPLDVVKTHIQTQVQIHGKKKFHSILDCVRYIVRQHGSKGLWRGVGARVVWMSTGTGLTMVVYEELKRAWPRH